MSVSISRKIIASAIIAFGLSTPTFAELITGTTLSLDFQAAQIQGAGKKLNMFRIPITDVSTGKVSYFDASFDFTIANGQVVFAQTSFAASSAVQLSNTDNFIPGNYKDSVGNLFKVSGPSTGANFGSRQLWNITSLTAGKTFDAQWLTGPMAGNNLLSAGFISSCAGRDGPAYGVSISSFGPGTSNPSSFIGNSTVDVVQSAANIIITSHNGNVCSPATSFTLTPN